MNTVQVDILNPKAKQLLQSLADLELIAIREIPGDGFLDVVNRIRDKAKDNPLSLEEITKEVESVRSKRYAKKGR
jgi:hypothetical protein